MTEHTTTNRTKKFGELIVSDSIHENYYAWIELLSESYVIAREVEKIPTLKTVVDVFNREWLIAALDYIQGNEIKGFSNTRNLIDEIIYHDRTNFELDEVIIILQTEYDMTHPGIRECVDILINEGFWCFDTDKMVLLNEPYREVW